MEIKNSLKQTNINENQLQTKGNKNISEEFQKEIDKKIKEENKEKREESDKSEKKLNEEKQDKPRIDTKDLTALKLFVLPYVNKDILSVNLKNYIEDKQVYHKQNNQELLNTYKKEGVEMEHVRLLDEVESKQKQNKNSFDFNPFIAFEKLTNSLKEISKEEKVKESKIIKELIEKLDIQKLENSRQVEIKFDRENIGSLVVQIINQDNKVSVIFKTSSKFLYDELKNNKNILESMLDKRNLKAEKIIIDYEEVI